MPTVSMPPSSIPVSRRLLPGAPKVMLDRLEGVSPETRRQVMAGGAMGFYGLA
jgi:hypothetical protein